MSPVGENPTWAADTGALSVAQPASSETANRRAPSDRLRRRAGAVAD